MDCNGGVVHGMDSLIFLCTVDGTVSDSVLASFITFYSIRPHAEGLLIAGKLLAIYRTCLLKLIIVHSTVHSHYSSPLQSSY